MGVLKEEEDGDEPHLGERTGLLSGSMEPGEPPLGRFLSNYGIVYNKWMLAECVSVFAITALSGVAEAMMIAQVSRRSLFYKSSPLPDLGFATIADVQMGKAGCGYQDLMLWSAVAISIGATILKNNWVVLRGSFLLWALSNVTRGCTMLMTGLPNPRAECIPYPTKMSVWFAPIYLGEETQAEIVASELCGTAGFSGHTALFTVSTLVWARLYPTSARAAVLAWTAIALPLWYMLACRFHYTLDIAMALFFVCMVESHVYRAAQWAHTHLFRNGGLPLPPPPSSHKAAAAAAASPYRRYDDDDAAGAPGSERGENKYEAL